MSVRTKLCRLRDYVNGTEQKNEKILSGLSYDVTQMWHSSLERLKRPSLLCHLYGDVIISPDVSYQKDKLWYPKYWANTLSVLISNITRSEDEDSIVHYLHLNRDKWWRRLLNSHPYETPEYKDLMIVLHKYVRLRFLSITLCLSKFINLNDPESDWDPIRNWPSSGLCLALENIRKLPSSCNDIITWVNDCGEIAMSNDTLNQWNTLLNIWGPAIECINHTEIRSSKKNRIASDLKESDVLDRIINLNEVELHEEHRNILSTLKKSDASFSNEIVNRLMAMTDRPLLQAFGISLFLLLPDDDKSHVPGPTPLDILFFNGDIAHLGELLTDCWMTYMIEVEDPNLVDVASRRLVNGLNHKILSDVFADRSLTFDLLNLLLWMIRSMPQANQISQIVGVFGSYDSDSILISVKEMINYLPQRIWSPLKPLLIYVMEIIADYPAKFEVYLMIFPLKDDPSDINRYIGILSTCGRRLKDKSKLSSRRPSMQPRQSLGNNHPMKIPKISGLLFDVVINAIYDVMDVLNQTCTSLTESVTADKLLIISRCSITLRLLSLLLLDDLTADADEILTAGRENLRKTFKFDIDCIVEEVILST